jgi:hypothetical protein
MMVIDCDQHLMEPRSMWADYMEPGATAAPLALTDDSLGYTWLTWGDRRLELALRQLPGETETIGAQLRARRSGAASPYSYDDLAPAVYTEPSSRLDWLDDHGLDATVLFPNYGLVFERALADDLPALLANMGAWNRYAGEVAMSGRGRLHPVGHLSLRDPAWVDHQLEALSASGAAMAMIAPAPVDGKRLSHPDLRGVWRSFVEHGVTPVFHVGSFRRPFEDAWYEGDPDGVNPVLSSVFLPTAAALALADLIVHGVLEELPELRIGVMELSAIWVPMFMLQLDGGFDFHARFNGRPLTDLALRPSEYLERQVRVAAFSYEQPDRLERQAGDLFMMCSDFPHSEGTDSPMEDYSGLAAPADHPGLYGDNVAWLLRQD